MHIAFYAPMKPPDHPLPSGDRTVARLLIAALRQAGCDVDLASRFVSFDGVGCTGRQQRLQALGERLSCRLLRRYRQRSPDWRPDLWFTYHVYHKAPDWLGPAVSAALAIPYVIAEASSAGKRATGPWAEGHAAAAAAIRAANLIIGLNRADDAGIRPLLLDPARLLALRPFVDAIPWQAAARRREMLRAALRNRLQVPADAPLLLTAAMMRPGDKLASYRLLADALNRLHGRLHGRPWRLLVAGDGPAAADVHAALTPLGDRVYWLGRLDQAELAATAAGADLFVWPALGEAWGMALLEAQAAGLPVIAGRSGGVTDVVDDGKTGLLVPTGDAQALALAVGRLLTDPACLRRMSAAAQAHVQSRHGLPTASRALAAALHALLVPSSRAEKRC